LATEQIHSKSIGKNQQAKNASRGIAESFEPLSSVAESRQQPWKQPRPSTSTDAGMPRNRSDRHSANPHLSIRESLQPALNVTVESLPQHRRQLSPRSSTDEGMQTDRSEEQTANANLSIRETVEPALNVIIESFAQ
jgi:hypothetical protein